jgi:hypothetical protein
LILLTVFFGSFLAACTTSTPTDSTGPSTVAAAPTKSPPPVSPPNPKPISTQAVTAGTHQTATAKAASKPVPTSTTAPSTITSSPTPTFDVNSIRTSTPAPAAKCSPSEKVQQIPTLEYNNKIQLTVDASVTLDYLNRYGPDAFITADRNTRDKYGHPYRHVTLYRDLTNDGVPEIVASFGRLSIFGCIDGAYQTLLETEKIVHITQPRIEAIHDLNRDGIPEILVLLEEGTQADRGYRLYEWGNGKFNSLFDESNINQTTGITDHFDILHVLAGGTFRFEDVDQDGMQEYVLHNGSPLLADYVATLPWRRITKYFKWNGQQFTVVKKFFDPPQYRFQAVEDADQAVAVHAYDQALDLYRQVIFNDKLDWWSEDRKNYIIYSEVARRSSQPFPETSPTPDPNEYLYLSAYARFRMMALLVLSGYGSDAQVVYETLLKKFPEGTPGAVYSRMAQAFWENYVVTHEMSQACTKSLDVVNSKTEVTRYLLNDYANGGWGKPNYTIEDLCPFK